MRNFRSFGVIAGVLLAVLAAMSFLPSKHHADIKYNAKNISILIKGTSSLHDWEMKSSEAKCAVGYVMGSNNKLTAVSSLSFSLPATSLKSGHNLMDNNTYKALNVKAFNDISFVLSSATVTPVDALNYQIKCQGKLTIAGQTRETELVANGKVNHADNSLNISGTKKMKMTEYNVKPPTVMMGTIKTGNDISIIYSMKITH